MGYLCDGRIQDSHSNQISSDAPSLGASPSGQSRPRQRYPEGFTCTSAASPPLPQPPHCLRLPTASALNDEVLGCRYRPSASAALHPPLAAIPALPPIGLTLECARASTARIAQARRPPTLTPSTAVPCLPLPLPPTPTTCPGPAAAAAVANTITAAILTIVAILTAADAQFFCAAASFVAATPAAPPSRQRPPWPPGRVPAAQAPRTCPTAPSPTALTAPTAAPPRRRRPSPLHRTTP